MAIPNVDGNSPNEQFEGEIEYLEDATEDDNNFNDGDGGIESDGGVVGASTSGGFSFDAIDNFGLQDLFPDTADTDLPTENQSDDRGAVGGVEIFNEFDPFMRQANLAFSLHGRPRAISLDSRRPNRRLSISTNPKLPMIDEETKK